MMDEEFFAAYRAALEDAAVLSAAVVDMEHERKRILAQEIVAQGGPVAKAENIARAGERYGAFLDQLKAARRDAAKAEAYAEYLRTRFESWRSSNATKRVRYERATG
jgi:hypothetical protein